MAESSSRKRADRSGEELLKKRKSSIRFDVPDETINDVCVVVKDEKFYVSRQQLARQSDFFKSLFFDRFKEKEERVVTLNEDIDPKYFQNFLELINCQKCLTDKNIVGVVHLADMFLADFAQEHCRDFLLEKSRLTRHEKFQLGMKYHFLSDVKAYYLSKAHSTSEVRALLTPELAELDLPTATVLIKKLLAFDDVPPPPPPGWIESLRARDAGAPFLAPYPVARAPAAPPAGPRAPPPARAPAAPPAAPPAPPPARAPAAPPAGPPAPPPGEAPNDHVENQNAPRHYDHNHDHNQQQPRLYQPGDGNNGDGNNPQQYNDAPSLFYHQYQYNGQMRRQQYMPMVPDPSPYHRHQ